MEEITTVNLVDKIINLALEKATPEIKTFVGHRRPDDDVWLCFYIATKFVDKAKNAKMVFVNAGETLEGSENDPSVMHFDTGNGIYDHHDGKAKKTCSAAILAEKLGVHNDPGLKELLKMVTAADNVEILPITSLHFLIRGWPSRCNGNGSVDWEKVREKVFEAFDIIYGLETKRDLNRKKLKEGRIAERTTLVNGLKIITILWHPELRDAAFEEGAAVVIWTKSMGNTRFYTGIQVNRNYPELMLHGTVNSLRLLDANARGIDLRGKNLCHINRKTEEAWFLHHSGKLILNGGRTWKLTENEYTQLTPTQIVSSVHRALSVIPNDRVSRWNSK